MLKYLPQQVCKGKTAMLIQCLAFILIANSLRTKNKTKSQKEHLTIATMQLNMKRVYTGLGGPEAHFAKRRKTEFAVNLWLFWLNLNMIWLNEGSLAGTFIYI